MAYDLKEDLKSFAARAALSATLIAYGFVFRTMLTIDRARGK